MAIDFPAGDPNLPDAALTGESLGTMHGGLGHPAATTRLLANIKALGAKLGYGASLPGAVAGVLRRTAAGQSAWGPIQPGDYGAGSIGNADINGFANIGIGKLAFLGNGNVLKGAAGANTAAQIADADVAAAAAIGVSKLAHVGAGNVLKSTGTANTGGQIVNADVAVAAALGLTKLALLPNGTVLKGASGANTAAAIVNADVDPAAAIALAKLAAGTAGLLKSNGTVVAAQQAIATDISPGGVANSVLRSTNGTVALFGSILAGDLAAGAIGQIVALNSTNQVCASAGAAQIPGTVLNWTSLSKPTLIIASLRDLSASGGGISLTVNLYDGGVATLFMINEFLPDTATHRTLTTVGYYVPAAGAHAFSLYWNVSAPQVFAANTMLAVVELH
jgi:hypothetical protein